MGSSCSCAEGGDKTQEVVVKVNHDQYREAKVSAAQTTIIAEKPLEQTNYFKDNE